MTKPSEIMRPIPLAPPVTRTTLPCGGGCCVSQGHTLSHVELRSLTLTSNKLFTSMLNLCDDEARGLIESLWIGKRDRINRFRSVEGGTNVLSCAGGSSSCEGVVTCHQATVLRLSRGIFCGPPSLSEPSGMLPLFPVLDQGRDPSRSALTRRHILLSHSCHMAVITEQAFCILW